MHTVVITYLKQQERKWHVIIMMNRKNSILLPWWFLRWAELLLCPEKLLKLLGFTSLSELKLLGWVAFTITHLLCRVFKNRKFIAMELLNLTWRISRLYGRSRVAYVLYIWGTIRSRIEAVRAQWDVRLVLIMTIATLPKLRWITTARLLPVFTAARLLPVFTTI